MTPVIRQAMMSDLAYVNYVMRHPEVYPMTMYDGKIPIDEFSAEKLIKCGPPTYVLIDDKNCFVAVVVPENSITWVVHENVLPKARGREAVKICLAMEKWMYGNTNCRKLIGYTPVSHRRAVVFAQICGFKIEGKIKGSILVNGKTEDLYIVGKGKTK